MRYLLAIILPPVAILTCGKPFQAFLNFILCIIGLIVALFTFGGGWLVPVIHAFCVVSSHHADQRTDRIVGAVKSSAQPDPTLGGSPRRSGPERRRAQSHSAPRRQIRLVKRA